MRVLGLLRAADGPVGVQEIAEQSGLHSNTARYHLDLLVDAGMATREPRPQATPGRPSMTYRARTDSPSGQRHYRLLAEMLTSMIAVVIPQPGDAAVDAGREWGRYITDRPHPGQRLDASQAIAKLTAALEEIGFAPETMAESNGSRIRLHQCPFREVAQQHQDVVCALHLGLMQGVLAELRAPVTADRLLPFAEPSACVAELSAGS